MSNIFAKTEPATAHAKGFVAESIVTHTIGGKYASEGYKFCLRLIDFDKVNYDKISATPRELYSIMSHQSGGSGLSFMPLVQAKSKDASTDLKNAWNRLEQLGVPLNMTIWLDEESLQIQCNNDEALMKAYKATWSESIIQGGYSVGYYYGGVDDCPCTEEKNTNTSVLSVVECAPTAIGSAFKAITIGDNAGTCKIRWAYISMS